MPIDNFTTDKYVGQEEELLEYVTVIADKFHPDMEIQEDGALFFYRHNPLINSCNGTMQVS